MRMRQLPGICGSWLKKPLLTRDLLASSPERTESQRISCKVFGHTTTIEFQNLIPVTAFSVGIQIQSRSHQCYFMKNMYSRHRRYRTWKFRDQTGCLGVNTSVFDLEQSLYALLKDKMAFASLLLGLLFFNPTAQPLICPSAEKSRLLSYDADIFHN